jgi:hypothetical protein
VETAGLVLIGLGCILTVFGTMATAFRLTGGGRLAAAGVLTLVAGAVLVMGSRGPA